VTHARDIIDYCQSADSTLQDPLELRPLPTAPPGGPRATGWETTVNSSYQSEPKSAASFGRWNTQSEGHMRLFYSLVKNNTCNLLSLCLRQRLLLTGLRRVSKHDNQTQHMVLQQSLLQDHSCADDRSGTQWSLALRTYRRQCSQNIQLLQAVQWVTCAMLAVWLLNICYLRWPKPMGRDDMRFPLPKHKHWEPPPQTHTHTINLVNYARN
jgi:hypothetical protein